MPITPPPSDTPGDHAGDPEAYDTSRKSWYLWFQGFCVELLAYLDVVAASATAAANAVLTSKVTGPASAAANALAKFDGTTGKLVKVSGLVEDAAGNLGVGGAPSAWAAGHKVVEFGTVANSVAALSGADFSIANNAFLGGSGWVYKVSAGATRFQQDFGVSRWVIDSGTKTAGAACNFTVAMTLDSSGNLTPGADNTQTNGSGSLRWSTIYAGTGTINTSDAREKTAVRPMAVDEIEAAKALSKEVGVYQFLDSVAIKGDKARHHIGMTVQRAIEIMEQHGLNPFAYGFICYDKWDEQVTEHPAIEARAAVEAKAAVLDADGNVIEPAVEAQPAVEAKAAWTEVTQKAGDRYSFRYDQLTLFIARGIHARLEALEAK